MSGEYVPEWNIGICRPGSKGVHFRAYLKEKLAMWLATFFHGEGNESVIASDLEKANVGQTSAYDQKKVKVRFMSASDQEKAEVRFMSASGQEKAKVRFMSASGREKAKVRFMSASGQEKAKVRNRRRALARIH